MRTAVDLDLWGEQVRVLLDDVDAGLALRGALATRVTRSAAPVGFVVKAPDRPDGFHQLLDRSGIVLARARGWADALAVLAEVLVSFAPPPRDTFRTVFRAVIRGEGSGRTAALVAFPLLAVPPIVERQFERRSHRIVDRLVVDITSEGILALTELPWPELRGSDPIGHVGGSAAGVPVDALLLPADSGHIPPATLVYAIAGCIVGPNITDSLDLAERLSELAVMTPSGDPKALLARLSPHTR